MRNTGVQEIIEVAQTEVKEFLKKLQTTQDDVVAMLYTAHDQYNDEYFNGELSIPFITISKLSNKTLANYTYGTDDTKVKNRIRFNRNFIALNTETRILETLKHEMCHQYQDEVLYRDTKQPKEWHNKDFKELCDKVGISCIGRKGCGSPARMPEGKSYNRKYACGCVASNGYPVTVWSTRVLDVTCNVCKQKFVEVKKAGKLIEVHVSHVEVSGQDAVQLEMSKKFKNFERYVEKKELSMTTNMLKNIKVLYEEGIYQKGHGAYEKGYRYWLAFGVLTHEKKKGAVLGGKNNINRK